MEQYSIRGVGRVGKPSRMKSRARRYWEITRFTTNMEELWADIEPERRARGWQPAGMAGWIKAQEIPKNKFPTATKAAEALYEWVLMYGGEIDQYALSFLR